MFRKFLLIAGLSAAFTLSAQEDESAKIKSCNKVCVPEQKCESSDFWDNLGYNLIFYFPNRALDMGDMLTMSNSLGMGALYFRATNYIQFGADSGEKYFITQTFHREYPENFRPTYMEFCKYLMKNMPCGSGHYNGGRMGFMCFSMELETVNETSGKVKAYKYENSGIASFDDEVYKKGIKDFWAIEADAGIIGWNIGFAVHPVEIADFIAGIFLIDISGDDLEGTTLLSLNQK